VECIDLNGNCVITGLIDGHVHLESSFLNPAEYAKVVIPQGVLAVVTDFHEIANIAGIDGIP
jgi:adenine deaminase